MDESGMSASASEDDVSYFSSDAEEQVIKISSHSRILISPRKTRSSAWQEKQSSGKKATVTKASSRRKTPTQKQQDRSLSRGSTTTDRHRACHANQQQASTPAIRKSGRSRTPGPAPLTSEKPTKNVSSRDETVSSEDESEHEECPDAYPSPVDELCDSDESVENENENEGSTSKPTAQKQQRTTAYKTRGKSAYSPTSLDDSVQSISTRTTPGEEMEELKATLKKLADHGDGKTGDFLGAKVPALSSATALREYLTAATAMGGMNVATTADVRAGEYGAFKRRHASFNPAQPSKHMSSGQTRAKSTSLRENETDSRNRREYLFDKHADTTNQGMTSGERLSLNKKLFGTASPSSLRTGKYAAVSAMPMVGGGSGGSAQGSRAVLSALKALQDKICRLEEERESLKQQLSDTKVKARKHEAELASAEKKFSYELGQMKESARAAYDSLRSEREELRLELVKSEERKKATQAELMHFQELTQTFSAKADDLKTQLEISESHRARAQNDRKEAERDHKRIVQELQEQLSNARQEHQAATERNEMLEAQFQRESSNHAESRERLRDSEQTVAAISQLNEKLVAKVWETTEAVNEANKKNRLLQQQQRQSTLSRSTAASRASAAAVSEATSRRAAEAAAAAARISAGTSSTRTTKKKKKASAAKGSSTSAKKLKKTKSVNNLTLLREANLGKEIPFLLGNSTEPSFSLIGNVQDALRRCDTTYVTPTLNDTSATTPGSMSSHRQTAKSRRNTPRSSSGESQPRVTRVAERRREEERPPSPVSALSPTMTANVEAALRATTPRHTSPRATRRSTKHKPPAIKVPTASPKAYNSTMQCQLMEDLGTAVEAAEKEFKALNTRYKEVVSQMSANSKCSGSAGSGSSSAQLSQALGPLLDELEAKAKHVNLLKQVFQQASNSSINPPRRVVHSPEAIRRKTASLRLLNEYRRLESDAKMKGSGGTVSPSSGLGVNGFFH